MSPTGSHLREGEDDRDHDPDHASRLVLAFCRRRAVRLEFFDLADGSLHEAVAAVDLAEAIGAVSPVHSAEIQAEASRLRAVLRGLMRAGGRAR